MLRCNNDEYLLDSQCNRYCRRSFSRNETIPWIPIALSMHPSHVIEYSFHFIFANFAESIELHWIIDWHRYIAANCDESISRNPFKRKLIQFPHFFERFWCCRLSISSPTISVATHYRRFFQRNRLTLTQLSFVHVIEHRYMHLCRGTAFSQKTEPWSCCPFY